MVHRAPDTRLLTSLLSSEKEVQKALQSIPSSSAAFAAYAAASPPHVSQTVLGVGGTIAAADEALRTYAASVERWRDTLERVRKMEDEVANIIRDRDILVGRLLKLSNSKKNRDSIVIPPTSTSPSLSHSTLSLTTSTSSPNVSSKLTSAQAELQACESQLAAKEKELDQLRFTAIRDGLTDRCRAMAECGWVWGEMGREGLRVLHEAQPDGEAMPNGHLGAKPLPAFPSGASSDMSSLGPEQSASQVGGPTVNGINGHNMNGDANPATIRPTGRPAAPPVQHDGEADGDYTPRLSIPPAHAISDNSPFPISQSQSHMNSRTRMERRITEVSEPASSSENGAESSEEEEDAALRVVENPRFTKPTTSPLAENLSPPPETPSHNTEHTRGLFARITHKRQESTSSIGTQPSSSGSRWLHRSKPHAATVSETHVPVATYGIAPDMGHGRERERKTSVWGGFVGLFKPKPRGERESTDEEGGRSRGWRRPSVSSDSSEEGGRPAWREEPGQGTLSFDLGRQKAQPPGSPGTPSGGRLKKRRAVSQAPGRTTPSASVSGTGTGWVSDSGRKSALKKAPMKSASDVDVTPRAMSPAAAPPPRPPQPTPVQARPQRPPSAPMKQPAVRPTSALQLTGDLSRSSSLSKQSVRSAPAHPTTPSRRGVVSPGPTTLVPAGGANLGRSASTGKTVQPAARGHRGGPKRASVPASVSESAVTITAGPAFPSAKTSVPGVSVAQHTRAATWSRSLSGGPQDSGDQPSLMTIVEGVTKANREGWSAAESSKAGRALVPPPPPMSVVDGGVRRSHSHRSAKGKGPAPSAEQGLQGVRAPPPLSAFDVETGKAHKKTRLEREMEGLHAPPPVSDPRAASYVAYKLETEEQRPRAHAKPLPAKSPLRSALRAPSPPPVLEVPSAPPRVRVPSPAPPPAPPPPTPATTAAKSADDAASTISSYESAHEEFYFSPDIEPDPPAPALPAEDCERSATLSPLAQAGGDSDVSSSTVAAGSNGGSPPARRKSVRMSLKPTFSPTPPALDDEGEEPWLEEHHGRSGSETRRGRRTDPEPEHEKHEKHEGEREREREKDLWEDSDSEDEEYRRAKDALRRAGRKKKW